MLLRFPRALVAAQQGKTPETPINNSKATSATHHVSKDAKGGELKELLGAPPAGEGLPQDKGQADSKGKGPAGGAGLDPAATQEQAGQEGAFNEETGEINWDCPVRTSVPTRPPASQLTRVTRCSASAGWRTARAASSSARRSRALSLASRSPRASTAWRNSRACRTASASIPSCMARVGRRRSSPEGMQITAADGDVFAPPRLRPLSEIDDDDDISTAVASASSDAPVPTASSSPLSAPIHASPLPADHPEASSIPKKPNATPPPHSDIPRQTHLNNPAKGVQKLQPRKNRADKPEGAPPGDGSI